MAYVDTSSSFRSLDKFYGDAGFVGVRAIVASGLDGDTPAYVLPNESGYFATALAASTYGYVGVPYGGSIASGCLGMIQIGGYKEGVQCTAAGITGSAGNAVAWTGAALFGTASAYIGVAGQIGILTETVSASTTANMFLTGVYTTAI